MDVDELKRDIQEAKRLMGMFIKINDLIKETTIDTTNKEIGGRFLAISWTILSFTYELNYKIKSMKEELNRLTNNTPECPEDCEHREGRHCLLGANHCTRRAEDFYKKK